MRIISTSLGIILSFYSEKDLSGVIDHLSGMKAWVEKEEIDPPYLYAVFDDRIAKDDIDELLTELKQEGATRFIE